MSLTVYDQEKGCVVLNPEYFKPVVNAFHPDYVKTYMPELLTAIKTEERMKANGENVAKTTPMKMHILRPSVERTEYHTYSKAGIGNVKPKGKKK